LKDAATFAKTRKMQTTLLIQNLAAYCHDLGTHQQVAPQPEKHDSLNKGKIDKKPQFIA